MIAQVLDTGVKSAVENMAIDQRLLEQLSPSQFILHFYDWQKESATYGYFTRPEEHFHYDSPEFAQLQLAKRSTGGGIIFHKYDFAFSLLVPSDHPAFSINTLENYAFINRKIARVIHAFSGKRLEPQLQMREVESDIGKFCMAKPTIYDVMIEGRKVAGGAQRRNRLGFLHQGSIALSMPSINYLNALLINGDSIACAMEEQSYLLLGNKCKVLELKEARCLLKELITQEFS